MAIRQHEVSAARGLLAVIAVENGTEFTSRALDRWADWNHVSFDFSRPRKPTDSAHVEAFNGSTPGTTSTTPPGRTAAWRHTPFTFLVAE